MSFYEAATADDIQFVASKFKIHAFARTVSDRRVSCLVIKMVESTVILINYEDDFRLEDLSLALQNPFAGASVIATKVLGKTVDDRSKSLAGRLSKVLNKTVYVSYNVVDDKISLCGVDKVLFEEVRKHPDWF